MSAVEITSGRLREPEHPSADPWSVVSVVIGDVAGRGIKSKFGDLSEPARSAADLLSALGVTPVIPPDDAPEAGS